MFCAGCQVMSVKQNERADKAAREAIERLEETLVEISA